MARFAKLIREKRSERVGPVEGYQKAMDGFLAAPPFLSREPGECWPSREEMHQRESKTQKVDF